MATPTGVVATPTASPDAGWTVADFENGSDGYRLIVDGDRLWAVGDDASGAAMWTSADGRSWQAIGGLTGAEVTDVVQGDAGYVAVGCDYPQGGDVCGIPLVWHSRDGRSWQRATLPTAPNTGYPEGVAYAFGRYVIVGEECVRHVASVPSAVLFAAHRATATPCPIHMMIWSSTDGQSWVKASLTDLDSDFAGQIFTAGDRLAVVSRGASGTKLWLSGDGVDWIPAPSFSGGSLRQVVTVPDGYVGIGSDQQGLAFWRSADGQSWQKLDDVPALAGLFLHRAVASDSGLVLFASSDPGGTVIWTSADAATWTQIPLPDAMRQMYVYDATQFHGDLIAIGNGQIARHALPLP